MSGVDLDGRQIRKGAADAISAFVRRGRQFPRRSRGNVDGSRAGGTPLVVADGARVLGVVELKDIVKGGIRSASPSCADGHQDGDDHRRQPADRRGHRRRGGRRRLPRRGHARGEARADPRVPGRGPAGGDDRRRHQRRAGAGAGRRRGGDELRHAGGQGGRQHGRSRLQPDQAARDRRDRQAAADDARRADHVQHRQRRRQVLRDHPGGVRRDLSAARRAQRDAARRRP
jgi:hypothetical protein